MVYIFSGAINQAIMPWVYKEFDMKEYAGVRLLYSRLLVLLCIVCLILISISDELLMLMGPTEYREYREVLQVLIFANFIQVCVMVEMVVLYFEKRTSWISIIMLASAGFIFLFNYLFLYDSGIEFSAWVLTVVNLLTLLTLVYINIKALGKRLVHFRLYMLLILSISILLSLFYVFPMLSFFRYIFTSFLGFLGLYLFLYYVRSNDVNFSLNRVSR
jgi:O-antigen/teichoic acid export membrane protein